MFYLTMLSTHFMYGYMVKDHSDRKREEPHCHTMGYSFRLAKGSFIFINPQTG